MTESKPPRSQTIVRAPHDASNGFFVCARATPQDRGLSFEARGMLWYFLSKPGDWKVVIDDLRQQCGRDKVYAILKELKEARYIKRDKYQDEKTKKWLWGEYMVYERPYEVTEQSVDEPFTEKPDTALPDTANTEINTQNTEVTEEKDSAPQADAAPQSKIVEFPTPAKRTRKPDPLFDAVKEHIFKIEGDAEGGRIGKISSWLGGKNPGKREKVGAISKAAEPQHVKAFAAWCERKGFTPPHDFVTFVENWRKWATEMNGALRAKAQASNPNLFTLPEGVRGFGPEDFVRDVDTEAETDVA